MVGGLLSWIASRRGALADLDERSVEQYLRHRAGKQSIQPGDRSALKRWLSVLREAGAIAPAVLPALTTHDRIFNEFDAYLRTERGLAPKSIVRHLPVIRRFLHEVCPAGDNDLGKISQEKVIRYIERHAQDWSPRTGKAMCWSLRAFLRYLHHQGLNPRALADCVPSMRLWRLASLPIPPPRTLISANPYHTHSDDAPLGPTRSRRSLSMISTGVPARCSFVPRADSAHECRFRRMLARPSLLIWQWPPKVVVSAVVHPHARAVCRFCFWVRDHDDRQVRS